jgi:hypothetical protein
MGECVDLKGGRRVIAGIWRKPGEERLRYLGLFA